MKTLVTFLSLLFFGTIYIGNNLCAGSETTCNEKIVLQDEIDIFEYLEETKEALVESSQDLSDDQMQYKLHEDSWSIAQIIEHIIMVEGSFKSMLENKIQEGASEMNSEVKMTDEQVVEMITNRSTPVQTQDQFQPSGKFESSDEALEAFKDQREDIVDWLKDSDVDMRSLANEFPFGTLDGHQSVLFLAGHTARHTAQIEEVKNDPDFPED